MCSNFDPSCNHGSSPFNTHTPKESCCLKENGLTMLGSSSPINMRNLLTAQFTFKDYWILGKSHGKSPDNLHGTQNCNVQHISTLTSSSKACFSGGPCHFSGLLTREENKQRLLRTSLSPLSGSNEFKIPNVTSQMIAQNLHVFCWLHQCYPQT